MRPNSFTQARDTVVITIENGHDDRLVDNIPHIYHPGKIRDIPLDAPLLGLQDAPRAHIEQPVCREGMPAEGMAFNDAIVIQVPAGRVEDALRLGLALPGLESAPSRTAG